MRHIQLTWNLGPHNDGQWRLEEGDADMVERTAAGDVEATWTVAHRRSSDAPSSGELTPLFGSIALACLLPTSVRSASNSGEVPWILCTPPST
jgi:hypothetical protein